MGSIKLIRTAKTGYLVLAALFCIMGIAMLVLPDITPEELRFWAFLADYYMCTLGEVYKAAYPLLKLRSEQTAADILARLQQRLARKEEQLAGRHGERVMQRLSAERDALQAQLAACRAQSGSADKPGRPAPGRLPAQRPHHAATAASGPRRKRQRSKSIRSGRTRTERKAPKGALLASPDKR